MLKIINCNQRNFLSKLEKILNKRKFNQKAKTANVNKIISNVKKNGDKAVLGYEKKFSKIKTKSKKITFTKKEINNISKKIDAKLKIYDSDNKQEDAKVSVNVNTVPSMQPSGPTFDLEDVTYE